MNLSFRIPIGVGGIITPWNFPMAIPTWKIFPALVCGNTVVFKPAELTPKTANTLVHIIDEAMRIVLGKDYIPGVINLVHGKGSVVGECLLANKNVDLISFTGSTLVGRRINEVGGRELKRVSLELGGKNAQIVMDDANMDLALDAVLWGAFGTTGQRCTATSRLILHKNIHDKFIEKLLERVKKLKLGYGNEKGVDVGPCVSESQRETVDEYVNRQIGNSTVTISSRDSYFGSSAFVDMIHSIQLAITGADISFAAPLSFDVQIRKGPINVGDMFKLYRFENMLYTMSLSGDEIKKYQKMIINTMRNR